MKQKLLGAGGMLLAFTGAIELSDIAHKSWVGLACGLAIFGGGMLYGKFQLQ